MTISGAFRRFRDAPPPLLTFMEDALSPQLYPELWEGIVQHTGCTGERACQLAILGTGFRDAADFHMTNFEYEINFKTGKCTGKDGKPVQWNRVWGRNWPVFWQGRNAPDFVK